MRPINPLYGPAWTSFELLRYDLHSSFDHQSSPLAHTHFLLHHESMMSQDDKYEKLYQEARNCCGEPVPEIAAFFEAYEKEGAQILDLGCGQGRDAIMMARHGHNVIGVDTSETGVHQMEEDAKREDLQVRGVIADITSFEIGGGFDVVILDRVLHMLAEEDRITVLSRVMRRAFQGGFILIADMPSNKPTYRAVFANGSSHWTSVLDRRGFLFMRKDFAN